MIIEMTQNYEKELRKCFSIKGRISRRDFWRYLVLNFIIMSSIASVIHGLIDGFNGITTSMGLIIFVPLFVLTIIGIMVKRVHDAGYNKFFVLIPVVNVYICLRPSAHDTYFDPTI